MPSWNDLLNEFQSVNPNSKQRWFESKFKQHINSISQIRDNRAVIIYSSAFLQKSQPSTLISKEDINGFMSIIKELDCSKGLTLILHTPGGLPTAAESIVKYLREKFTYIEVVVPTYAMSAGTMVALGADQIIMGKHSFLGPIDPQFILSGNRQISAHSIVSQFETAKKDFEKNPKNMQMWIPILSSLGLGLLEEAKKSLNYSKVMVQDWLTEYMLKDKDKAQKVADFFIDVKKHLNHGRPIGLTQIKNELNNYDFKVEALEDNDNLQEAILTTYHLITLFFENTQGLKMIRSVNKFWGKFQGVLVKQPAFPKNKKIKI